MKKIFSVLIMIILSINFCMDANNRRKKAAKVKVPTVEQVVSKVDAIVAARQNESIMDVLRRDSVAYAYVKALPVKFDRKKLSSVYIDRMAAYSEAGNVDQLRSACLAVIAIADTVSLPMAYEGLAQIYAFEADTEALREVMDGFASLSSSLPDDPFSETIATLTKEYDDVLNPVSFEDKVRGKWVTINRMINGDVSDYPWLILDVKNLDNNGIRLCNFPGRYPGKNDGKLFNLLTSQHIGGRDGHIEASFGSEYIKYGDSEIAESGFEATRQFRANMRGTVASSNAKIGDKVAATAATEVIAGLLDRLFEASANSNKTVAALNLSLNQMSPVVMEGNAQYYNYTANVKNMYYYRPIPLYDGKIELVRWASEDSVYFVDNKGNINSIGPVSTEYGAKLEAIKLKYSWKRSKYIFPIVASEVAAAGLITGGVVLCNNSIVKDSDGNPIYEPDGGRKINNGKIVGGTLMCVAGIIVGMVPVYICINRVAKRNIEYGELNKENMLKLQRKAAMSLSPLVELTDCGNISLGVGCNITF